MKFKYIQFFASLRIFQGWYFLWFVIDYDCKVRDCERECEIWFWVKISIRRSEIEKWVRNVKRANLKLRTQEDVTNRRGESPCFARPWGHWPASAGSARHACVCVVYICTEYHVNVCDIENVVRTGFTSVLTSDRKTL